MTIETKFSMGQKVYRIVQTSKQERIPCVSCKGKGTVLVESLTRYINCPDCYGYGGTTEWMPEAWRVDQSSPEPVGNIRVSLYQKKWNKKDEHYYMLPSSGIQSGSLIYENNLFATEKEAESECELRNKSKKSKK